MIHTETISLQTKGNNQSIDITSKVQDVLTKTSIQEGLVHVFVTGSTAGLTTIEFEPGLQQDLDEFFSRVIPQNNQYHHNEKWGDGNGHSHIRASLLKPNLTVPFKNQKLLLGTWQQIVLVDFDNRSREREVIVQFLGE